MKLIDKLNITSIIQQSEEDESLARICGSVQIEDNGHVAVQQGSKISYVCGKNEYSFGKYKIRFNVNKKPKSILIPILGSFQKWIHLRNGHRNSMDGQAMTLIIVVEE